LTGITALAGGVRRTVTIHNSRFTVRSNLWFLTPTGIDEDLSELPRISACCPSGIYALAMLNKYWRFSKVFCVLTGREGGQRVRLSTNK